MSIKEDDSINKTTDYFYEKMKKGYNSYINSRKTKYKKRIELIKYLDSLNQVINYNDYLNKNHNSKNNEISMNPSTKYSVNLISNNLNKSLSNSNNNKNNKKSNLHINLTSSNFYKNKNNTNQINLKTSFNNPYIKQKLLLHFNNFEMTNKNSKKNFNCENKNLNLGKNTHLNSNSFNKNLKESNSKYPSLLKNNKSSNLATFKNKINTSLNKTKLKLNKSRKIINPFKYSNNYMQNCILKQILVNPDLKLLYDTNENRAKKSVKSQNELSKKKFSLVKYQTNLIENALLPLDSGEKKKLLESFNKINLSAQNRKKVELNKYLKEIQKKEKDLIENHNEIEVNYGKNIEKIGFSPIGKRKIHIGKMLFKDIFIEKKKRNKYKQY